MNDLLLGLGLVALAADVCLGARIVRRLIQECLAAFARLELRCEAIVRKVFRPRYVLEGACQQRGACCTQIMASPPKAIMKRPWLRHGFIGMHRLVHNFHLVGESDDGQLAFRCGHLTDAGRCGIYRFRPRLCRTYPLLPFFSPPKLLPGCGYKVRLRGLGGHPRLHIVDAHVATHHPTPPHRSDDTALEHADDFVWVAAEGIKGSRLPSLSASQTGVKSNHGPTGSFLI